jgi:hypothetical protein
MLYILTECWKVNWTAKVKGYLQLFGNYTAVLLRQEILVLCFGQLNIQNVFGVFFACNNAELLFSYR